MMSVSPRAPSQDTHWIVCSELCQPSRGDWMKEASSCVWNRHSLMCLPLGRVGRLLVFTAAVSSPLVTLLVS